MAPLLKEWIAAGQRYVQASRVETARAAFALGIAESTGSVVVIVPAKQRLTQSIARIQDSGRVWVLLSIHGETAPSWPALTYQALVDSVVSHPALTSLHGGSPQER